MFLDISPGMVADAKRAVDRGDAEAVRRAAHAVKGMAANLGAKAAAAAALRLEDLGRAGDLAAAAAASDDLAAAVERLRPVLTGLLAAGE
jgi:HPt (histidine-containing phosphotransfer) domain-containing protein